MFWRKLTSPSICIPVCGDGRVFSPETCDDGSQNNEGCNSSCSGAIFGWNCVGGAETSPSVCVTVCGDGLRVSPETCDDGIIDD